MSSTGALYEKNAYGTWSTDGEPQVPSSKIALPALLLWSPSWDDETCSTVLDQSA